ncbi:MAG TPA: C39 family peptidase [Chloroflexia bacterium]|nr:C39 family peptidase [Chloroflexia bacterium]
MARRKALYFYSLLVTLLLAGVLAACGDENKNLPANSNLEVVTAASVSTATSSATTASATTAQTTTATTTTVASATTSDTTAASASTTAATSAAATTADNTTAASTKAATTSAATTKAASATTAAAQTNPGQIKKGVLLEPMSWEAQTWNNCAPMSAKMALSYFGINVSQAECGKALRPNGGDKNDPVGDKHVEPYELVNYITGKGLKTKIVENGTFDQLRALLSAGVPVITQQWLHDNDDIAHYRVARGYDLATNVIIFNDSMDRKPNTIADIKTQEKLWKAYDHRFLPVYTAAQAPAVNAILGEDANPDANMSRALAAATKYAAANPGDIDGWRNLGYLQSASGDCKGAIQTWENHITKMLTPSDNGPYNRFLWYQFWPVVCYNQLGNYNQVIKMVPNEIEHAKVFAEARYQYAVALVGLGRKDEAVTQLKKALLDDNAYQPIYTLMSKLGVS